MPSVKIDGSVMVTEIVLMDPMKKTVRLLRVGRINFGATTANVFQAICSAVDRPNAMILQTKPLAIVSFSLFLLWDVDYLQQSKYFVNS